MHDKNDCPETDRAQRYESFLVILIQRVVLR